MGLEVIMMKSVYPVFFTKTNDVVLIEVPDLEILTEGKDMSDAIEMARDAIELKCVCMEDSKEEIPQPSDISTLDTRKGTFAEDGLTIVSLVDIDSGEYRRKIDNKTVRRNVALPSWLNYEAEHAGINVSRVLQEALMNVLNVQPKA
jgi:predicted RNase H-like HicB family nuclease